VNNLISKAAGFALKNFPKVCVLPKKKQEKEMKNFVTYGVKYGQRFLDSQVKLIYSQHLFT
jgi:hypothetical protein